MVTMQCSSGGTASLTKVGGDVTAVAESGTGRAYVGRTHPFTVTATPSSATRTEISGNTKITYHWELDSITAAYVTDADGAAGQEAPTSSTKTKYEFLLSQAGNYKVNVTFKEVAVVEEIPEPEPEPEPDDDRDHGNGNGRGNGNGDGNGDGNGQGNGSGDGTGDGDNGSGTEAGGGDGGTGDSTTITDPSAPSNGEASSENVPTQTAQVSDTAQTEKGDRSDVAADNAGERGGSQEGGSGDEPADNANVVPKVFEVVKDAVKPPYTWIYLLLLLLLAIAGTAAARRYRRFRKEEGRKDNEEK